LGPNSLLPTQSNFPLLDESGLSQQIIEGDPHAPRFVVVGGVPRKVPFGAMTAAGLLRMASEPFVRSKATGDESIRDFFVRRLGREAEERLVSPFITGIYAGSTSELSMAATFPKWAELERQYGSLIWGMWKSRKPKGSRRGRTCSFSQGMEELPRRLASECNIACGADKVVFDKNLRVRWNHDEACPKAIVIATPSYRADKLIEALLPRAAQILSGISYAPIIVATVSIVESALPAPLRGFGFLVPRSERLHLLGTLYSSALFPGRAPKGHHLLTAFLGGSHEAMAIKWTDEYIWNIVRSELQNLLKTSEPPEPLRLVRRTHAIPQYRMGHTQAVEKLRSEIRSIPGLFLTGNYMSGVSVAACMESGEQAAREVASFIH
jgi:oxygen-dependent protoporphyrinogen oxidase